MRTVIVGGPKTGKTTLSDQMSDQYNAPVMHTDDTIGMGWSEGSAEVATWFGQSGPWIVEGVAAVRALRKWLAANPEGQPCDRVLYLTKTYEERKPGQITMAAGVTTVFREISRSLEERGVEIVKVDDFTKAPEPKPEPDPPPKNHINLLVI